MKKIIIAIVFLVLGTFIKSFAQASGQMSDHIQKAKILMLKDYAAKNATGFRKHLDEFLAWYNKQADKEKETHKWFIEEQYYLLADTYALAGDKKNALDYLEKSENYDIDDLNNDHDLDCLRKEPRYVKFENDAKKMRSSALTTLQKSPKYNIDEKDKLPEFTYQQADNQNLVALKTTYNLDSIAGKGDDVSKIINLMEWVHYLVPHDGSKGNPEQKNAQSFIAECKRNNKTLNCRGLGILLNEVYLAEGFKSRFVTCLPKDTADNDCHVITMVWAASLKKWVWMDPTFMAYVMDETGELLSIEEVRDRLINDKPLILNPDANRNHAASQSKNDYLGWYMAKNLYKLQCPVSSEYNYETKEAGKTRTYVELLPGSDKPAPQITKDDKGNPTFAEYYTNSAKAFWAPPMAATAAANAKTSRTTADYEEVMGNFKKFYNNQQTDSIVNMFESPEQTKDWFTKDMLDGLVKDYGKMVSYKYLTLTEVYPDEDYGVAIFKIEYDRSIVTMGISLNKNNKMGTFRFSTSSPYIDKQLAKEL